MVVRPMGPGSLMGGAGPAIAVRIAIGKPTGPARSDRHDWRADYNYEESHCGAR